MTFDQQGTRTRTGKGVQARTRRLLTILAGTALVALAITLAPRWAYALPVCGSTISSCCKITTSGNYTVSGDFTASGYSACIKIKAPGASLDGGSHTITGPGATSTMKGLVIEAGAGNTIVGNLTMSGFATGVEADARKEALANINENNSGTGIIVNGKQTLLYSVIAATNTNNGIVINGKAFLGVGFGGQGNNANGVVFNPTAVGAYALGVLGVSNAKTGVKIKDLTSGWFQAAVGVANGTYGVWLRGTSGVSLSDFAVTTNGIAGVYLGCHGDGPSSASCPSWIPPTNQNTVVSTNPGSPASTADGGTSPVVQQYGVAIDAGNYLNHVLIVEGSGNSVKDGYDGNSGCGSNTWFENSFATYNQSCVNFALH